MYLLHYQLFPPPPPSPPPTPIPDPKHHPFKSPIARSYLYNMMLMSTILVDLLTTGPLRDINGTCGECPNNFGREVLSGSADPFISITQVVYLLTYVTRDMY